MIKRMLVLASVPLVLAACDPAQMSGGLTDGLMPELPEFVLENAAPYQDLSAVKIDPEDGCYVYRHVGPVETTFLPLRSKDGRPICTRAPGEATG